MSISKSIVIVLLAVLVCAIIAKAEDNIPLPGLPGYYAINGDGQPILLTLYDVDVKNESRNGQYFTVDGFSKEKKPIRLTIKNGKLYLVVYDANPNRMHPEMFKLGKLSQHRSSGVWNMVEDIPLAHRLIGDRHVFEAKVPDNCRCVFHFGDGFKELGIIVKHDPDRRFRAFYLDITTGDSVP